MLKTGAKWAVLGVVAGAALFAGCEDSGRSRSMVAAEDYYPNQGPSVRLLRGVNTGIPREVPEFDSATGGSGIEEAPIAQVDERAREALWLRQDFRVPYPPSQLEGLVAVDLGTGKELRANAQGVWVQGLYALELGAGLTEVLAPASAPYQPQVEPVGDFATPQLPLERP